MVAVHLIGEAREGRSDSHAVFLKTPCIIFGSRFSQIVSVYAGGQVSADLEGMSLELIVA